MSTHAQHLSLTEFWHPPEVPAVNQEHNAQDMRELDHNRSWGGMTLAECRTLPARGWPEGVKRAEELLSLPDVDPLASGKLTRRWAEDGDTLDVARFYDGLPCYRQPYRTPGGTAGRIKTVVIHTGANAHTTADELAWRAYAAVRYVDAMESAGYRVALVAQYSARGAYVNGDGWECRVTVKQPEDPLDLSQVAAVLSAGAFRCYGFTWEACHAVKLEGYRGKDTERPPDEPNTVYLPGTVRDRAGAERWLAGVNVGRD